MISEDRIFWPIGWYSISFCKGCCIRSGSV